jgi:hypothetical protein
MIDGAGLSETVQTYSNSTGSWCSQWQHRKWRDVISSSLRHSGKKGQSKRTMLKRTRPSSRQRMEDPNTSRTAGLVLEAVTRFLSTSGSAGRVVNALTWSALLSKWFQMILSWCWTTDGRKNRSFIGSYLETWEEKWKMYSLGRYNCL